MCSPFGCGRVAVWRRNVPVLAVLVVLKLVFDHPDHDVVTDKASLVHDLLRFHTKLGLLRDLVSQHVTRCKMADTELVANSRSLGSFTYSIELAR